MPRLPDLVRDTQLVTDFKDGLTIHSYHLSDSEHYKRLTIEHVRWQKERKIGAGGYGRVYVERRRGKTKSQHPEVRAVKRIADATHRDYLHELEAIAKFSQPRYAHCFVKSYGWYEHDDSLCIAMEYLQRGDLEQTVRELPSVNELDAVDITIQLLEGLNFMHDNDFAHRDMKPRNVLVMSQPPDPWWVKIADFGISKRLEQDSHNTTALVGTPDFMAPDLLFEKHDQSLGTTHSRDYFKGDVWALGCMTYYILTKRPPFDGLVALLGFYQGKASCPSTGLPNEVARPLARDWIGNLLKPSPEERPTIDICQKHLWIQTRLAVRGEQGNRSSFSDDEDMVNITKEGRTSIEYAPSEVDTMSSEVMGKWTTIVDPTISIASPRIPVREHSQVAAVGATQPTSHGVIVKPSPSLERRPPIPSKRVRNEHRMYPSQQRENQPVPLEQKPLWVQEELSFEAAHRRLPATLSASAARQEDNEQPISPDYFEQHSIRSNTTAARAPLQGIRGTRTSLESNVAEQAPIANNFKHSHQSSARALPKLETQVVEVPKPIALAPVLREIAPKTKFRRIVDCCPFCTEELGKRNEFKRCNSCSFYWHNGQPCCPRCRNELLGDVCAECSIWVDKNGRQHHPYELRNKPKEPWVDRVCATRVKKGLPAGFEDLKFQPDSERTHEGSGYAISALAASRETARARQLVDRVPVIMPEFKTEPADESTTSPAPQAPKTFEEMGMGGKKDEDCVVM